MKHLFRFSLLLLALLLPATALAYDFEVDGIYYNINGTEATVTFRGTSSSQYSNEYSGDVTIPATVTYGGTTYDVTSIGDYAFSGCSGLTSVTIPNSVTSIGYEAFSGCSGLTSVTIPNSVTSIGSSAFDGTAWYDNQPDGLVYAGLVAYKYKGTMPSGTSITLRNGTLGIAGFAFENCRGLTSIEIPNSVTFIGEGAFFGCSGLTSIDIPNSVTSIGEYAFYECSGLTSVTIPNSVTSIGVDAFYIDNSSMTRVEILDIAAWCNIEFEGMEANPLYCCNHLYLNGSEITELTIPNSVTSIGAWAFIGCTGLTSATIPNSVTTIGQEAFAGCEGLTSVTLGNSVTTIDSGTFDCCWNLTEMYCLALIPPTVSDNTLFLSPYIGTL